MSKEKHMVVEINGGEASATTNAETSAQENGKVESSNKAENKSGDSRKNVPLSKLFAFADGIDVLLMIMGTIGAIVTGLGMPAMTVLFGSLVDSFGQNSDASQISSLVDHVFTTGIRFVYLGVVIGVGSFFEVSCWMCTGERQATRIRSLYLETILRQDIKFFDTQTSTGEVVATLAGDTALIQDAMGDKVGTFLQLMTTFFGGLILALVRGWKLALVLVATTPLLICGGTVVAMVMTKASSRGQQAFEAAGNIIEQTISAIRTVASFGGEKKAIKGYDSSLKPAYITAVQTGLAGGFGLGFLLFAMYSSYALALWYGSRLIINEGYTGGRVINVIFAVLTGGMSLSQASPSVDAFAKGQAAAYKMFQTFKRKPEIDAFDKNGLVMENIQGDIEFKDVYFSYPARPDVQIFSNFSLSILKGSTTAIVGESGSGKSTVINLIERFYDPQAGEVLIDGIDIKKFQLKWIREKIGLVSQEPVLFATTIKDNIAYGKDGATLEEIQLAAEIANAAKFIRKMPLGFETLVGEHGSQLSGGQKQRIAIARAILKDPRILLLDEATSALDAGSERKVQNALDKIMLNRTTVVVAHRLTTVKNADTIVVVQRGTIVEKGSHSQLMSNPLGAYFQLMSLQEMDESKEQVERCSDHIDMPLDEARIIDSDQNPSSRALSFRKSQSSRSIRTSGNQPYDGLEDVDHGNKTFKGDTKQANIFRWFARTKMEDMETGRSEHARNVPLLRLAGLNQPEIPVLLAGSISAAIVGLSFPFFGLLFSHVIYSFFEPPEKLTKHVRFWSFMFLVLATTLFVMAPIQKLCFAIAGGKLVERIRSITFKNLIYQEIAWFDDNQNSSGALVARLSTDAAIVRAAVGDALSLLVQNIATITAGIIISFTASWKLALLILALFPLFGLHGWIQVKFLQGFSEDAKMKYEQASHVASEAVGSIRTVASFCAEEKVLKLYNEKCKAPLKKGTQMGILSGVGLGFSNFAMYSSYTLMFWVGSRMVKSGEATFGDVFRVFFAITMTALGVSKSMGMAPDFGKVQTSVNSVFNILDRKSKIDASDDAGEKIENVKGDVQVCHVNFSYPSRKDVQVFRDLNIFFPCGKTVALVGESGSGKSTVIALLQRFYDPDSGCILLDGIDIKKLQVKWLREQMGLVSQEPVLFNDTIRANIAYGKDGLVTEEQIIEAAKASNAHQFISALPQGYDTLVGERGIQLSGGQKQRIAIARAIVKDPKILLLDEATSALDAESERLVQDALDHVKLNRTTIVVAHRLSTIKDADVIAVVKNGAIVEEGSHDELLAIKNGAYASLVKLHMSSS